VRSIEGRRRSTEIDFSKSRLGSNDPSFLAGYRFQNGVAAMNLAVLLLSCTGSPRLTDFDRPWAERVFANLADYYRAQSGGRENMQFQVFDWFQLSLTSDGWNNLGFGAGPTVRPMVEAGLNVDLSSFDHFALVIDKFDAALAAVSPTFPIYVHVGAQSLDPALVQRAGSAASPRVSQP
jgi:hypothetical protein